jgi:O-antigen ligase
MGTLWLYTVLRFGMFLVLWGLLYLLGVGPLTAALIGLVLSIPLAYVLLARPRARLAQNIELRVQARQQYREDLDAQLDPEATRRDTTD